MPPFCFVRKFANLASAALRKIRPNRAAMGSNVGSTPNSEAFEIAALAGGPWLSESARAFADYDHTGEKPLLSQVLQDGNHEERIALGAAIDQSSQAVRNCGTSQLVSKIFGDLSFLEWWQRDLIAQVMNQQILLERLQGVRRKREIHRPIRADEHQFGGLSAAGQRRNEIRHTFPSEPPYCQRTSPQGV